MKFAIELLHALSPAAWPFVVAIVGTMFLRTFDRDRRTFEMERRMRMFEMGVRVGRELERAGIDEDFTSPASNPSPGSSGPRRRG